VKSGFVDTPLGQIDAGGFPEGDVVEICVRISDLRLNAVNETDAWHAQIRSRRFMGVVELIELGIDGRPEPVRVRIRAGGLDKDAKYVHLSADPEKIMMFSA